MSTAQYEQSDEHGPLFVGWEPRECGEHRTVGDYRAWCFDCTEWCYSREIGMACKGCEVAHLRAADPAASTADAPADTVLRDQIAQYARDQTTLKILDALLPLLRAHDAQTAAQAWSEGSQAATAWINQTTRVAPVNPYRAASPQPARDQAHDET